jgi:predicted permease
VLLVLAVTVAAVAAGVLAERRTGEGAQRMARRLLDAMLYALLPFAAFFLIADLELTAGVRAGIGVAYAELTIVGLAAYAVATRVLRLTRPAVGAVLTTSVMANTGYLGLPLSVALLGSGALGAAVAWDTLVSSPVFLLAGFAIGAIFGDDAGTGGRQRLAAFVARNPPLLATIAGLLAPDALAPDALVDTARVIVFALLPVGFFVLGVNLAAESDAGGAGFPSPFSRPLVAVFGLRLVLAPALVLAASAFVVELPDPYLLQAAMPSGINALVVAHAYGLDLRLTSAAIAWTTTAVVVVATVGALVT